MNLVMFWATVLSPIIGAIAIGVALYISHKSSKEAQKQIDAVYNLLDVFVAAQNPSMLEAKKQYEQQLMQLNRLIKEARENMEMAIDPSFGRGGALIDDIETMEEVSRHKRYLESLLKEREEVKSKLDVINAYLDKMKKYISGEINEN